MFFRCFSFLSFFLCLILCREALASPLLFNFKSQLSPGDYEILVKPIVNPSRFTLISPPSSVGLSNVEAGVGVSYIEIPSESRTIAENALVEGGEFPKWVAVPRVVVQGGVPGGLDVALAGGFIPYSRLFSLGLEGEYHFLEGPDPYPNVSGRLAYSALIGGKKLSASAINIEVLGSVFVSFFEPYMGVGFSFLSAASKWTVEGETGESIAVVQNVSWNDVYFKAGSRVNVLSNVNVTLEYDLSSLQNSLQTKVAVQF